MISILTEPVFASSFWCSQYMKGINQEAKRKSIEIISAQDVCDLQKSADGKDIAILIGTSLSWLRDTVTALRQKNIRPVVLSAQKRQRLGSCVSYVTMDYEDAIGKLMTYLQRIGRSRPALFAVNPDSATDQNKRTAFLCSDESNTEDDIYYFNATLDDACRALYDNIDKYDTVICANHISEIVLTKFLSEQGIRIPENIHIAAFGDRDADLDSMREHTLIRIKGIEAGKLAVRCVRLLTGHPDLSSVSLNVSCDIITSEGLVDFSKDGYSSTPLGQSELPRSLPTDDHISSALMHERILCNCDRVDIEILKSIIARESYAKIAHKVHISENTIGYRIKRLMQFARTTSKDEMINALKPYLS